MARRTRLLIGMVALFGVLAGLAFGAVTASGDTGPPVSTVQPTVKGSAGVGKELRTTTGNWSTSATFTYQWLRCNADFADCTDIPGATAATYTATASDVGHVLAAHVTATNAAGSAVALSDGRGPVESRPPGVKHTPWIRGTKKVGHVVVESGTVWTRAPYMWRDRWLRCSSTGHGCVPIRDKRLHCVNGSCLRIENGLGEDYKVTKKDVGHRLRVRVTAVNGAGHTTSTSPPTRIIRK